MSLERPTLVIEQGALFPSSMRMVFGFVGLLLSVVLIGIPILAMSIYYVGTEIDPAGSKIRHYGSVLGIRWGKWTSMAQFKAIVILGTRRVTTMYSRGQVPLDQVARELDVTLVDETHREKFVLKACERIEEARTLADKVSEVTGLSIERYGPRQGMARRR